MLAFQNMLALLPKYLEYPFFAPIIHPLSLIKSYGIMTLYSNVRYKTKKGSYLDIKPPT